MGKDRYDRAADDLAAAEFLARAEKRESAVREAWLDPYGAPGGLLFQYACPSLRRRFTPDGECACLTVIKSGDDGLGRVPVAFTPELTRSIRDDFRIPKSWTGLMEARSEDELRRMLVPFVEWRRRLDSLFRQPEFRT